METPKPKKMADLVNDFKNGVPVLIVEYRKGMAETISWRDKASGKAMTAPVVRHTVETASASVSVAERVEDTFDTSKFVQPFAKGAKVAFYPSEMTTERGQLSARGVIVGILEG